LSSKGIIGGILGSIAGSVGIMSLILLFVTPMIFPGVGSIVLQSVYHETTSQAYIIDDATSYQEITETGVNITIQQSSRIIATFSGEATLSISSTFMGAVNFRIDLVIKGVGNRSMRIHFYDGTPGGYGSIREYTHNLYNVYQTEALPAGTYSIVVSWKSESDATGINQLLLSTVANLKTRALLVQEII